MKLIFICGSYENGKDGVGDYVRRLANSIIQSSNEVAVVALNDPFVSSVLDTEELEEGRRIQVLRFPAGTSWNERINTAKKWVNIFNPDWLSLQYVHFAYNPKGLPFFLENHLLKIGGTRKWSIMFHELWVGMPDEASKKHKIWGQVQRILITRMVRVMRPAIIHTQCQLYITQLRKLGYKPHYLPLFSNIPVIASQREERSVASTIRFVVFGTVHPFSNITQFAKELAEYLLLKKQTAIISFIGRNGAHLDDFIAVFNNIGIQTNIIGEQSPENISALLALSQYGIATAAPVTIEKNGTVIAMWDHGLPVICIGHNWKISGIPVIQVPEKLQVYKPGNLADIFEKKYQKQSGENNVKEIANTFTADLQKSIT